MYQYFYASVIQIDKILFYRTFQWLWKAVGENLTKYSGFPKLVGECGGKNYHFVHTSADVESVVKSTARSAFEYQGQKCSACSRMYVPESLWPQVNFVITHGSLTSLGTPSMDGNLYQNPCVGQSDSIFSKKIDFQHDF